MKNESSKHAIILLLLPEAVPERAHQTSIWHQYGHPVEAGQLR